MASKKVDLSKIDFSYSRSSIKIDVKKLIKDPQYAHIKSRLQVALAEGWDNRIVTKADVKALEEGCWYSQERADKIINFIQTYVYHTTGTFAKSQFILLPWQKFDIECIFGWIKENELNPSGEFVRRFRRAYIEIPKKNGKTTLAAAIGLYLLMADGENNPLVFTAATTRNQAGLCFQTMRGMVKLSDDLKQNSRVYEATNKIKCLYNDGSVQTLSSEAGNEEGHDASGMIIDELHAHKNRKLYDCLRYAGRARNQPLTVVITTSGVYDPTSIGWEVHKQAESIINGSSEDISMFARIYCADMKNDDLSKPETWCKANPSLGLSLKIGDFQDDYNEAVEYPDKWLNFCRYSLNIWSNTVGCWIPREYVDEAVDPTITIESFTKKEETDCSVIGIDLASSRDMGAVVFLQRMRDGTFHQKEWYFVPEDRLTAASKNPNRDIYQQWANDGFLITTPGKTINYRRIYDTIVEIDKTVCTFDMIGVDPWNATQLITDLKEDFGKQYVHSVRQGYVTMSPTMKQFEILLFSGKWKHSGNPITAYCFNNCAKKDDGRGNIIPIKSAEEHKIDGVSATLTALNCTMYLDDLSRKTD